MFSQKFKRFWEDRIFSNFIETDFWFSEFFDLLKSVQFYDSFICIGFSSWKVYLPDNLGFKWQNNFLVEKKLPIHRHPLSFFFHQRNLNYSQDWMRNLSSEKDDIISQIFPSFLSPADAMSCQSHLHISPQSVLFEKLHHSWRLERSHLGWRLQRKLHYLDEILLCWAHRWLLVPNEMFIVLSQSNRRKLGSVGFIATAERADHDY